MRNASNNKGLNRFGLALTILLKCTLKCTGSAFYPEPTIEDLDGDGILDGEDNCPRTFNPVQEYPEGEGFPEPGEACPFVKNEDKGIE